MSLSNRTLFSLAFLFAAAIGSTQYWTLGENTTPYSVNNAGQVAGYDMAQYYLWSVGNGYQGIGGIIPGNGNGGIPSISSDGKRVGGTALNTDTGKSEMAYYDVPTNQWHTVGSLGSSSDSGASAGFAMNGSGTTIVGNAWVNAGSAHAFRWNNGTTSDLGSMFANTSSRADGVSDDGTLIGGYQDREDGYRSGAVWVNGVESLLENGTGDPLGAVHAVTANGQFALGGGGYYGDYKAYLWNASTGLTMLDNPFFDWGYEMVPTAANADGTLVVGYARDYTGFGWGSPDQGWIWTPTSGVETMEQYATSLGIYSGDFLSNPLGVSNDGRYIVGQGTNAAGTSYIGWAMGAPVPEPATMLILGGGLATIVARRRRKTP